MSIRIYARPGRNALYLRGTVRGQRVFESTGTNDPAVAEEIRIKREAELLQVPDPEFCVIVETRDLSIRGRVGTGRDGVIGYRITSARNTSGITTLA